ncbi:MAG: hypothetical protein ACRELC_01350 [Gemmatimonadota bacterium]
MNRSLQTLLALALGVSVAAAGCNSDSTGPGDDFELLGDIVVLNSVGKTLQRFDVEEGDVLTEVGQPITLPANFDGASFDAFQNLWVTTISALGGSQVLFGTFTTEERAVVEFPAPEGALADPSRPTMVFDIGGNLAALVAGRGSDAFYLATPTQSTAVRLASDTGEFVERILPASQTLIGVDGNIDDDGGTFQPLGDPRLGFYRFLDGSFVDEVILPGAPGVNDAIFLGDNLLVLAGGSFGPAPGFAPVGDGQAIIVSAIAAEIVRTLDLEGNGVALEGGRDGQAYITRTTGADLSSTDVLVYSFATGSFARGPADPIQPRETDGSPIGCWAATALRDGRVLCLTFDVVQDGRLVLLDGEGAYLSEIAVGRGATDLFVR